VRTHFFDAVVIYETARAELFDDSCAREERRSEPHDAQLDAVVADFIKEVRAQAPGTTWPDARETQKTEESLSGAGVTTCLRDRVMPLPHDGQTIRPGSLEYVPR